MKLPLILVLALAATACDRVLLTADPTPSPATPLPATPAPRAAASPTPKPGAWMWGTPGGAPKATPGSALDKSGALGAHGKK